MSVDWMQRGWLPARAAATPHLPALAWEDREIRYASLLAETRAFVRQLRELGVRSGDTLALHAPNGPVWAVALHALRMLEATLLPLNRRLAPAELLHPLVDSGARWLLVDAAESDAEWLEPARAALPALGVIVHDGEVLRMPSASVPRGPRVRANQPAPMALLYTSGTTGRPKGAMLTAAALDASARAAAQLIAVGEADRWLACMPFFHIGGLSILVRACIAGGCVRIESGFDPDVVRARVEADGITQLSLVANMLSRLLDAHGEAPAPASLRCVLVGGGPTPVPLLERAAAQGFPVAPTYGLTEAGSQVATRVPGDIEAPLDGRLVPLPGISVRVVDAAGHTLPSGDPGELCVRGPTVMRGYLHDVSKPAAEDSWLYTGDLGVLDSAGRVRVLDRRDDLIVSGGENVYPAEVETVLLAHPYTVEAAVVARADARYGARPVAFVVARDIARADATALLDWCRTRLAGFKVPVEILFREALPRGASGKLLRRELRLELANSEARPVEAAADRAPGVA